MRLRTNRPSLLAALVAFLCVACSNKLTRPRAADLIQANSDFQTTKDVRVVVGTFWYDWRNIKDDLAWLGPLQRAGILDLRDTGTKYAMWWKQYIVTLTPNGEKEAKKWIPTTDKLQGLLGPPSPGATIYRVPIASREFREVTGIALAPDGATGSVEFTWKWAPTAQAPLFAEGSIPQQDLNAQAYFQLYDDGWRLVKLHL